MQHPCKRYRFTHVRYLFIIWLISLTVISYSQNQDPTEPGSIISDTSDILVDTIVERRNGMLDVFEGRPGTAAFRGLLLPAGGQIYNRRWWKVPLALGLEGAAIFNLAWAYNRYSFWDKRYINEVINNPDASANDSALILKTRNDWRSKRELGWVIWGAAHIFVAFEAYIDRHLIDFDVSDDLTVLPEMTILGPIASISYTIPITTQKYRSLDHIVLP